MQDHNTPFNFACINLVIKLLSGVYTFSFLKTQGVAVMLHAWCTFDGRWNLRFYDGLQDALTLWRRTIRRRSFSPTAASSWLRCQGGAYGTLRYHYIIRNSSVAPIRKILVPSVGGVVISKGADRYKGNQTVSRGVSCKDQNIIVWSLWAFK
jgi:hypothetical protein